MITFFKKKIYIIVLYLKRNKFINLIKKIMKILTILPVLFIAFLGFSKTHIITSSGLTFSPITLSVNPTDTIEFKIGDFHNAVQVSKETWETDKTTALSGGFNLPFGGGTVLAKDLVEGNVYYVCTPHASLGMKGTIEVKPATKTDSMINILEGEWLWTSSTGGICGCTLPGDKSKKYVFEKHLSSPDSVIYSYFINDNLIASGSSIVIYVSDNKGGTKPTGWYINLSPTEQVKFEFSNSNNTLSISNPSIVDLQTEHFERSTIVTNLDTETLSKEIIIYPNPVINNLTISGAPNNGTINISNMSGNVISIISTDFDTNTIDMTELSNGVYIINIVDKLGTKVKTEMIVVTH